ncbi:Uncharacterised protein [Sphingobacterium mizutaii]|uniref:Uncharacterized protein n=1 Tax=Sphingobacterium mizutaii TaxID=1010 RepID=A0AAJ4XBZ8_9SPHI|nr:hypothetical protein SAMN05192578_101519 [Sphingobacterium mizutaii]SNV48867.1 Uncharacterised protein [Sphingobacterium mizutaii]
MVAIFIKTVFFGTEEKTLHKKNFIHTNFLQNDNLSFTFEKF